MISKCIQSYGYKTPENESTWENFTGCVSKECMFKLENHWVDFHET